MESSAQAATFPDFQVTEVPGLELLACLLRSVSARRYGATKAFLSNLAASLSVEVRAKGIDVLAVHPSPVNSQFYNNLDHKIDMMDKAKKSAVAPNVLPEEIFKSIGRVVWRDIGGMAIGVRVGTKMLSYNFLGTVFAMAAPYLPDYKKNDVGR